MVNNKFKFNLKFIKENLNLDNFIKEIYKLEYAKYGGGDIFINILAECFDGFMEDYTSIAEHYDNKENEKFRLEIEKYQFDGTLLSKLSDNFILDQYFDFGSESHCLIHHKTKNDYLYIFCIKNSENYVKEIFKDKLNKVQFFEHIIKLDKKAGMFLSHDYCYTSTDGVDYYDLYKKGKL
jgi:hypothetical protein